MIVISEVKNPRPTHAKETSNSGSSHDDEIRPVILFLISGVRSRANNAI